MTEIFLKFIIMNYFVEKDCKEISLVKLVSLVSKIEEGLKKGQFNYLTIKLNKESISRVVSSNRRCLSFEEEGCLISFSPQGEKEWKSDLCSVFNNKIENQRLKSEILDLIKSF